MKYIAIYSKSFRNKPSRLKKMETLVIVDAKLTMKNTKIGKFSFVDTGLNIASIDTFLSPR